MKEETIAQAIIPCKSTSKRIKNKNFLLLENKPLFIHTTEKLLTSPYLTNIIIDSDDPALISDLLYHYLPSHKASHITVHERPKELAQDDTPMIVPIVNVIEEQSKKEILYDYTFLVYACAVLIDVKEMRKALTLLHQHPEWLTVNNVVPGPNPEHSLALTEQRINGKQGTNTEEETFYHAHWQIRKENVNSSYPQAFYPSENWELFRTKAILRNPKVYVYDLKGPCIVSNPTTSVALDNPEDIDVMKAFYYYNTVIKAIP